MIIRRCLHVVSIFLVLALYSCKTDTNLVGYWKLNNDAKDYSGAGNDGINHGVTFSAADGAVFNGAGTYIEVPDSKSLDFGDGAFSISAWIKCEPGAYPGGDIVNKYDSTARKGLNFQILNSSSAYNGPSDSRNLFFGIDNAVDGQWTDCGRPIPTNDLISMFIVYKNHLYVGTTGAMDPKDRSRVFRYDGDGKWVDCGMVTNDPKTPSIMCGVIHKGELYVGTGNWDYVRQDEAGTAAAVYKYKGGTTWERYGNYPLGKKRIHSMASYNGTIYVNDDNGETYSYDTGSGVWKMENKLAVYKFISSGVYNNELYNGSNNTIFRMDINRRWDTVAIFDRLYINQTHTFETYQGRLYAGTWPNGYIMRYEGGRSWTECAFLGTEEKTLSEPTQTSMPMHKNEIQELLVYNGKMYAGVIPKGEVWRYDGFDKATLIKRLVHNPGYSIDIHDTWSRVPAMAIFQGKLFAGTGTARGFPEDNGDVETGRVFSWEAGKAVTYDDDLGTEWRHVVAVREGDSLKLYIDGKLTSKSSSKNDGNYDLDNDNPLLIGFGSQDYFRGRMKEVRMYTGALSENQITTLYNDLK